MNYTTVFDVRNEGFPWLVPGLIVLFAIGVIWFTIKQRSIIAKSNSNYLIYIICVIILLAIIVVGTFLHTFILYTDAQKIIRDGTYLIVEGQIENFIASKEESFTVAGVPFKYSIGGEGSPGFTHVSIDGGP